MSIRNQRAIGVQFCYVSSTLTVTTRPRKFGELENMSVAV